MSLIVFTGPMFSGKTTKMIIEVTRYSDISKFSAHDAGQAHNKPLIINHSFDTRNVGNIVSSHSSLYKGLGDNVDVLSSSNLSTVDVSKYSVVGVDECNFFPDLYENIKKWVSSGKHVICAGLDGNSNMESFGKIHELLPIADEFIKLRAICSICVSEILSRNDIITPLNATPASFTDKVGGDPNMEVEVGGSDKYIAVCRRHHKLGITN